MTCSRFAPWGTTPLLLLSAATWIAQADGTGGGLVPLDALGVCTTGECGHQCANPCECSTGVLDCAYDDGFEDSDDNPLPHATACAPYDGKHTDPTKMHWAIAASSLAAPVMAFGIGANDIANSWATSVGSGAISVRNAVMIGAVAEFAGAITLGFGVAKTIQKGVSEITDAECWGCGYCNSKMGLLLGGTAGALVGASSFLMLATYLSLPVSTTHSIVGGIVGMTIVGAGPSCLNWAMKGGLGGIIASWFISPALSGLLAATFYTISRKVILGASNPRRTTLRAIPILFGLSTGFVILMMMFKSKAIKKEVSPDAPYTWKILLSLFSAIIAGVMSWFFVVPYVDEQIGGGDGSQMASAIELGNSKQTPSGQEEAGSTPTPDEPTEDESMSVVKVDSSLKSQANEAFKYVLVFIACLECFAHGSNDTANATGPFTASLNIYRDGLHQCDMPETPVWIMALGGFFLSLGVLLYGKNVIQTIGSDIASVDYHKAFWIELAATFAVIFATVMSFPVSTTHCKIGAVVAVGIVAPKGGDAVLEAGAKKVDDETPTKGADKETAGKEEKGVDWGLLTKIVFTWVFTIPIAGAISAAFVAIVAAAM